MGYLFTSRKFWVALFALLVVIVGQFVPGFSLDGEAAAGFAIVVVSYVIGVAVDPGPGGWRGVLKSRKFWAAAVGFVLIFLNAFNVKLPLMISEDQLVEIAVTIGAYIGGTALEKPKAGLYDPVR